MNVKKCTLRVAESPGLLTLAEECRRVGGEQGDEGRAGKWVREAYEPHCSLMYADIQILDGKKKILEDAVKKRGLTFDGEGEMAGWSGGEVWLVNTSREFDKWAPVAVRKL